jgi:hypothetical protein
LIIRPIWLLISNEVDAAYLYLNRQAFVPLEHLTSVFIYTLLCWLLIKIGYSFKSRKLAQKGDRGNVAPRDIRLSRGTLLVVLIVTIIMANVNPQFRMLYMVSLLLLIYLALETRDQSGKFVSVCFSFLLIVLLVALLGPSDDRRDFAVALAAILLLYITSFALTVSKMKMYVIFSFSLLVFGLFSIGMRQGTFSTSYITLENVESIAAVELDFPIVFDTIHHVFDHITIDNVHGGIYYLKPFFWAIPRSIFPDKPETLSRAVSRELNPLFYASGGSEPLTIYGEFYFNFYWYGSILFLFVGKLLRKLDDYWLGAGSNYQVSVSIVLISSLFYLFRGPIDTVLVWFVVFFAFVLMLPRRSRRYSQPRLS